MLEVLSDGRGSRLTVEVADREFLVYPSLNLFVTLSDDGFCEARGWAWVALDEYKTFVAALRQCEQTRRGQALLSGMSPGELEIVVESSDSLGHFQFRYTLGRTSYGSRTIQTSIVAGGFDLDAEFFAQMVSDFAGLLPMTAA